MGFQFSGIAKQILPLLAIGVIPADSLLGSTHDEKNYCRSNSNRIDRMACGRKFGLVELICFNCWCIFVFCHINWSTNFTRINIFGYGKRIRFGFVVGWAIIILPNMLVIRGVLSTQKTLI